VSIRLTRITWSQLAGWQRSFGAKAAVALPILGFAVAILPASWFDAHLAPNWRLHSLFWGAILFLAGQVTISIRRPIEFARETEVQQDIAEAQRLATFETFKNRCLMLERVANRFDRKPPIGLDRTVLVIAKTRLADAKTADESTWSNKLPFLVISQRSLREFDDSFWRLLCVGLLSAGTALMALPTLANISLTAWRLLHSYWTYFAVHT
jgi:hypothetical protein